MTTTPSSTEYIPSGTDEAEAIRYREALSHLPVGEESDYSEEFRDAGFYEER